MMTSMDKRHQEGLEIQLNDFAPTVRKQALEELVMMEKAGMIKNPAPTEVANMHCHTFYSFNAYHFSPSGLAWLARKNGYALMGKVDFDVLDGIEEFLQACDRVGVRGSAAIETRVFFKEFATRELNSPGEPGIYYHMGIGLTEDQAPEPGGSILADMRRRSAVRNQDMIARLNKYLYPVYINYDQDVLPMTPAGNATERHILAAYLNQADQISSNPIQFWSDKLGLPLDRAMLLYQDVPAFQNQVRSKLMKRGGPGYTLPGSNSFPSVQDFHRAVTACHGLICAAWVDGLSAGEQAMDEQLDILVSQGAAALNIIPDRNWNISDVEMRKVKVDKLYQVVDLALRMDLPLNVGTEMNTYGQKLIDDFNAPELEPVRQYFLDGAYFIYGHTVMQTCLGLGYHSSWSQTFLPTRRERNSFYTQIGKKVAPGPNGRSYLGGIVSQAGGMAHVTPGDFITKG
jgi:hypothetical protein